MRYVIASLLEPTTALIFPVLLALSEFLNTEPLVLVNGSYDDASQRVAGLFVLIVVPIAYLASACFYAGAAHVLAKLGRFSRKSFLWVTALAPWSLVLLAAIGLVSNNHSDVPGLFMLLAMGLMMSLLSIGGAVTWLLMAIPKTPAGPSCEPPVSDKC